MNRELRLATQFHLRSDEQRYLGRREDFDKYLAAVPDVSPLESDRLD